MRLRANFELTLGKALWAAGLALAVALSAGARECPHHMSRDAHRACATQVDREYFPTPAVPEPVGLSNHQQVTQYVMDFDGDHSLDLATVIEQATGGYAHYTIQLRLASGAEQSIVVAAPPGGLQLEMHDMTGDKIPNDLVLKPALLRWLPTVLVNDGHDHFAEVISGTDPGSMSSGQKLAPGGSDGQDTVALMSSGFKAGGLAHGGGLLIPQIQERLFSPTTQIIAQSLGYSPSSGRAPPVLVSA